MDYELMNNNRATVTGTIIQEPRYSHEVCGEGFYESAISVKRLSDQIDTLPITVSERLLADSPLQVGDEVSLIGQLRSYNKMEAERSKLMLSVFVREISSPLLDTNPNSIYVTGYVCKEPIYRTTPFNREICDVLIAVNRAYNKSDYLPCIAWGRNARFVKGLEVGTKVMLEGRIQSRNYQKQLDSGEVVVKTAYEVSVCKIDIEESVSNLEEMVETY
ncbi:MAG: single-stranded DNA-binding protein [Clostridia bacterium]|nr:single-stranded DNA-binding protein [Clostridia bacterium]